MASNEVPEAVKQAIAPKRTRNYRALAFQGYLIVATITLAALFVLVWNVPYFTVDLTVTRAIQTITWPWFAVLMEVISFPGNAPISFFLVGLMVVGLFVIGLRWEAASTLLAGGGGSLLDTIAKAIVHRARPTADIVHVVQQVSGYSFPSGHVVFFVSFLGFLMFLTFSLLKERVFWRSAVLVILAFFVATVGVSRIYLGAHWFSDVLGAYLLGSLWLGACIWIYRWGKPRFFTHQPAAPEKPQVAQPTKHAAAK